MKAEVEFYQQEAHKTSLQEPLLAKIKAKGLKKLLAAGFPTRHDEAFKYSPPDAFLKERFIEAEIPEPILALRASKPREVSKKRGVGREHILVCTFADALKNHKELIEPYLKNLIIGEHGFQALNTAMLKQNLVIYLPKGVKLKEPIKLSHLQNKANNAVYARYLLILEPGSELTLIEDYQGEANTPYLTNVITEAFLHKDSALTHVLIQRESQESYHFSHFLAHQEAGSKLHSHAFHWGGKWVRSDKSFYLNGCNAEVNLNGLYALKDKQHLDQHTLVDHKVGACISKQDYKGIISGSAEAVFNGKVVVQKNAQKTQASQQNKNILLSQTALVNAKPELVIEANDVMCTHGATVGQLDEEALFYCLSRGMSKAKAIELLINGFISSNISTVEDKLTQGFCLESLHKHLQGA
ncbi:MAG: Fe-S cluster assembly protein SufD [Legionellales bacterium RIFCSPHIGHO2_12_FULL_37_14]|nr:MAG: Fe-S cluster assembly protein SufD [Legionellales bacterium RIFCSPHIGHO2_12_FULL_37_14]